MGQSTVIIIQYSRNELTILRHHVGKPVGLDKIHTLGILHYRGCRAGNHERQRRRRCTQNHAPVDTESIKNTIERLAVTPGDLKSLNQIEVIVGHRPLRHKPSNRVNSKQLNNQRTVGLVKIETKVLSTVKPSCNKATPAEPNFPPSLYVFNAAALSKPHAIDQLDSDMSNNNIDVAIISETHLKNKHLDSSFSINGFKLHRKDRQGRKGGGVAVFVRDEYRSSDWCNNSGQSAKYELLWIKLNHSTSLIFIGALYHPPTTKSYSVAELLEYIEQCVDELIDLFPGSLLILAGDLNQLPENEIIAKTGLEPIVRQPTRGNAHLDRIYVSNSCYDRVQVLTSLIPSDHKAIVAAHRAADVPRQNKQSKIIKYRPINPNLNARFLDHISRFVFENGESKSVQEDFDHFYQVMMDLMNAYYPEKTVKLSNRDPEYMTPSIKWKLKLKNKLMRQGKIEQANALSTRIGLEIARANSTRICSKGKSMTAKDLWSAVKKLSNRSNNLERKVPGIDADVLNRHYARISHDSAYRKPLVKHTANLNCEFVSEYQVFKLLDTIKPTAAGLDKIPSWFLRMGAPVFAKEIARLYNKSITNGVVPKQWKQAYIHPIAKLPTPVVPADYRPISITSVLCRMMEKLVVRNYIYPAMLTPPAPLSFSDQFAFRPQGSTTAAIISLLHKITTLLLTNTFVVVIGLDFSKAFDTVRHVTMMEKFSIMNIPDNVYNWITDFFTEHEHCTVFDGNISPLQGINASVIQGSGIGPSSYAVNASDLRLLTSGNDIIKFADDFYLVIPASNLDSRSIELQHVEDWAEANNLQLNRNKSQEIVFFRQGSRTKQDVPELPGIPRVSSIKVLGVTISDKFSVEEHVANVISSSARSLYALRLLRSHGMRSEHLQLVFQATIISRLQYASPAWWGFTNSAQRDRLEAALRKSVKAGFYSATSPNMDLLCSKADTKFFSSVDRNEQHILRSLLPPKRQKHYDMRGREHEYTLPEKNNNLYERNFLVRILYNKNERKIRSLNKQ